MTGTPPLPFDGTVLLRAGATASLSPERLPVLLRKVQADLADRLDDFRREYERVHADAEREVFLVEPDHWDRIGERLGFNDREANAVRRAHTAQLERLGAESDREAEFETALEIRDAVVIGTDSTR